MKFGIINSICRVVSVFLISLAGSHLAQKKQGGVDGAVWADHLVWGENELWYWAVDIRADPHNPPAGFVLMRNRTPMTPMRETDIMDTKS